MDMDSLHFCGSALGGLPQKSWFHRCIAPRSFYYLEKKETPQAPLIKERRRLLPSIRVRALASLVADELRGAAQLVGQAAAYRVQRRLLLLHDRRRFGAS